MDTTTNKYYLELTRYEDEAIRLSTAGMLVNEEQVIRLVRSYLHFNGWELSKIKRLRELALMLIQEDAKTKKRYVGHLAMDEIDG